MVKDHSDSKRGNLLPQHRLLFPISSKGSFICTYRNLCYTSREALADPIGVHTDFEQYSYHAWHTASETL